MIGICDDGTPCDLSYPNCADGSGCVRESPATFDCPAVCFPDREVMQNDVWCDWMPSAGGEATIETCGEDDESTPNTTMVVYEGCDCPPEPGSWLGCSEYVVVPGCFGGSSVTTDVIKGNCHKIRIIGLLSLAIFQEVHHAYSQRRGYNEYRLLKVAIRDASLLEGLIDLADFGVS